jgi:pyridoxamine---pyruvate transaminase
VRAADITLSAGPVMMSGRVRAAMAAAAPYHYDPAFTTAYGEVAAMAGQVLGTSTEVVVYPAEAIAGLEAAARALVHPGMRVLNLVCGVFGAGMSVLLRSLGADVHERIEPSYRRVITAADVAETLDRLGDVELVCFVHCETPSGTLCDAAGIAAAAATRGALTLTDCVSSAGGHRFTADEWGLDVCVTGSQKCLAGPVGVSLISVSAAAWQMIEANPAVPRGTFLSLLDWRDQWRGSHRFPFTPAVSDILGLHAALAEMRDTGLSTVIAQHAAAAAMCRAGVTAMGLRLWPEPVADAASCVTAIAVPDRLDDEQVRDHARHVYGVQLSGGQGAGNLIRIGHMGPSARSLYPVLGLVAVARTFTDLGVPTPAGAGVEAALAGDRLLESSWWGGQ